MTTSLVQMVQDLQRRVENLETERSQYATVVRQLIDNQTLASKPPVTAVVPEQKRKMCPKCGVKPNHFFHVKTCTGKKEEQKDASSDGPGLKHPA